MPFGFRLKISMCLLGTRLIGKWHEVSKWHASMNYVVIFSIDTSLTTAPNCGIKIKQLLSGKSLFYLLEVY